MWLRFFREDVAIFHFVHIPKSLDLCRVMLNAFGGFYRPRSEASEGYVFTAICLFNSGGWVTWSRRRRGSDLVQLCRCHPSRQDHLSPRQDLPPEGKVIDLLPPPPHTHTYGHYSQCVGGQYASYWNAFLS